MLSDSDQWSDADKMSYRTSLGLELNVPIDWANGAAVSVAVSRSCIVPTSQPPRDVFLDPDTGIGNKEPRFTHRAEHVYVTELVAVAAENPERILVVYQHHDRQTQFPTSKLELLSSFNRFACVAGDVALIFISRTTHRLPEFRSRLEGSAHRWTATPLVIS